MVRKHDIHVLPSQAFFHDRSRRMFHFVSSEDDTTKTVRFSEPTSEDEKEDLETFESIVLRVSARGKDGSAGARQGLVLADAISPASPPFIASPALEPYSSTDLRDQLIRTADVAIRVGQPKARSSCTRIQKCLGS